MTDRRRATPVLLLASTALALAVLVLGCAGGASSSDGGAPSSGSSSAKSDDSPNDSGAVRWFVPPRPIRGVRQRVVGSGERAAAILCKAGAPPPRKAVIFLHGWHALPPYAYGSWLRHLVGEGNTIVYPVYQGLRTPSDEMGENAIAGIRSALDAFDADPRQVAVIGHVTGGAIAFDYAARAEELGLPSPRAVFAVYPARNPPSGPIPAADLSEIQSSTYLAVVAGTGDPIPEGNAQARTLLAGASRVPKRHRTLLRASAKSSGSSAVSVSPRRSFWTQADRLIAKARG